MVKDTRGGSNHLFHSSLFVCGLLWNGCWILLSLWKWWIIIRLKQHIASFTEDVRGSSFELPTLCQLFFPSGNVVSTSEVKYLICKQVEGKKNWVVLERKKIVFLFWFITWLACSLHDFTLAFSSYVEVQRRWWRGIFQLVNLFCWLSWKDRHVKKPLSYSYTNITT